MIALAMFVAFDEQRSRRLIGVAADEDAHSARSSWARTSGETSGRHDVHHVDVGIEVAAQRRGVAQCQLRVRAAAHRRQDALHVPECRAA